MYERLTAPGAARSRNKFVDDHDRGRLNTNGTCGFLGLRDLKYTSLHLKFYSYLFLTQRSSRSACQSPKPNGSVCFA